jgi:hypothetical protein
MRNLPTYESTNRLLASALAQVALDDPLAFFHAAHDLDETADDEPPPDTALALLKAALPRVFAKIKFPDRWQPYYLAPLADGTWMPLNADCTPVGYPDIRPYVPGQFPGRSWEFATDPRQLKGVWHPHSPCGGHNDGWNGMWLAFRRGSRATIGKVIAATQDPLKCAEMLLPPWHDPPPPTGDLEDWQRAALAA